MALPAGFAGLGSSLSYPTIPAPTEVPFRRCRAYQGSTRPNSLECVRIAAGGNVSYYVVETDDGKSVDLLAVRFSIPPSRARNLLPQGQPGWYSLVRGIHELAHTSHLVLVLQSGQGQFGGLGNGLWAHATSPVRVKTVSGLHECEMHPAALPPSVARVQDRPVAD